MGSISGTMGLYLPCTVGDTLVRYWRTCAAAPARVIDVRGDGVAGEDGYGTPLRSVPTASCGIARTRASCGSRLEFEVESVGVCCRWLRVVSR